MVPAGANPHSYEPTPRQMALLGQSALFVKAGSGVEFELDWMLRLLDLNRNIAVCNASEGVTLLLMSEQEHAHEQHTEERDHEQGHPDPHFWLSLQNGRMIAANVERALSLIDPSGKEYYAANAASLSKELEMLDLDIRKALKGVKSHRFLVFHPAWGYFAHDYGLKQIAAEEEGKTLTPRQLQRVISRAREEKITVVFVSPQFSSTQAEAIARDIGGRTVMVDPLSRDYTDNLRQATAAFVRSMQ
jgi:zinc transport system substrate-binding protein